MTPLNLRMLCAALGFTSVIAAQVPDSDWGAKAIAIGRLIEAFCLRQNPDFLFATDTHLPNEADAAAVDNAIERHILELRNNEMTYLPADRVTLLKYYDRLQHRKTRRTQSAFYATADEAVIANLVLRFLDEEIEND